MSFLMLVTLARNRTQTSVYAGLARPPGLTWCLCPPHSSQPSPAGLACHFLDCIDLFLSRRCAASCSLTLEFSAPGSAGLALPCLNSQFKYHLPREAFPGPPITLCFILLSSHWWLLTFVPSPAVPKLPRARAMSVSCATYPPRLPRVPEPTRGSQETENEQVNG